MTGALRYFAYGSNMLTARLERRVGPVELVGRARIAGRRLTFHKRSGDGSGKCDIPVAESSVEEVHGVVYEMPDSALEELDRFEGGYKRTLLEVDLSGNPVDAHAYLAQSVHVERGIRPFDWYLQLVHAGTHQHGLVEEYRSVLGEVLDKPDPVLHRSDRLEALGVLREFYAALERDSGFG